jgi:putative oxidoreductase
VRINQAPRTLHNLIDQDGISFDAGKDSTLLLKVCAPRGARRSEGIGAGEKRLEVVDSVRKRQEVAMSDAAGAFVLAGRILIGLFFGVVAAVMGHIAGSKGMEEYARSMRFPIPAIAGWPTGLWLVAASVSVGLGIWGDVGALMIAAFLIPAAAWFHRFWEVEDETQKLMQTGFFFRNVIGVGASLIMFGIFAGLGPELPFTVTDPLFTF